VAFTKVLSMYQVYHTWIHPLHHCLLSLPTHIPGMVSIGIMFAFTYMCTQYLHHIHPPIPLFTSSSISLVPNLPLPTPRQDLFYPPVLLFCRRKKRKDKNKNMRFLLV
jgi:hypothetical protein